MTDEKHSQEEAEPGRNSEVEKVRREKIRDGESQRREDAGARKVRKVAKHCVFRLAKATGAEPAGQMRDEKWHAIVARSTFASQNVQNTSGSEHFWKLSCGKSARHSGAKRVRN